MMKITNFIVRLEMNHCGLGLENFIIKYQYIACGMEFMHATHWLVDHHSKIISVKLKSTKSEIIDPVIIVIVINGAFWNIIYVHLFVLRTVIIFSKFVNYKRFGPIPWYCMCSPNLRNDWSFTDRTWVWISECDDHHVKGWWRTHGIISVPTGNRFHHWNVFGLLCLD